MTRSDLKRNSHLHGLFMAGKWACARDHWRLAAKTEPDLRKVHLTLALMARREYRRYMGLV